MLRCCSINYCSSRTSVADSCVHFCHIGASAVGWTSIVCTDEAHTTCHIQTPGQLSCNIQCTLPCVRVELVFILVCVCVQQSNNVDPVLYMTEWFMCLYTRTLPWRSVLRVLDMFFCEGL
jgi:hypothetical protein